MAVEPNLAEAVVAAVTGSVDPADVAIVEATILAGFLAWESPALRFDVTFDGPVERGRVLPGGSEIDLFAVPGSDPVFAGYPPTVGGVTYAGFTFDSDRLLTNGTVSAGRAFTRVDIFLNLDTLALLATFLTREQQIAGLQRLVTHESGHAIGLGHPVQESESNLDTDVDPLDVLFVNPDMPFEGLIFSSNVDETAVMNGPEAGLAALLMPALHPDDRGGRDVLYPSPFRDRPVAGRKMIVKGQGGGLKRLIFQSKDPDLLFPEAGGFDDPASPGLGAVVEVFSRTEGRVRLEVPSREFDPTGWKTNGRGSRYRYTNGSAPAGPTKVRTLRLQEGKQIKVVVKGLPLPLAQPQEAVGIRIQTGSLRNCALFEGAAVRRDIVGRFVAVDAAAGLTDCSDASMGVPTTTTTSTSTSTSTSLSSTTSTSTTSTTSTSVPPASDCCVEHVGAGCETPACESYVCSVFQSCCSASWDEVCALLANTGCSVCQASPGGAFLAAEGVP